VVPQATEPPAGDATSAPEAPEGRPANEADATGAASSSGSEASAAAREPGGPDRGPRATFIVTLAIPEATTPIDPGRGVGRTRAQQRARRSARATDALERRYGFRATHRYAWALAGFSARLTPGQARRLARDPAVAEIRAARPVSLAAQAVPTGVRRVHAEPDAGAPAPDVDVDVAIVDTGIGPVGGNELNIAGGVNCSGDGLDDDVWDDLFSSRHGTHVAGIVAARDNGIGVVGVAPGARLWSLRVFQQNGYGDEGTVICALDWAVATHGPAAPPGSQPIEVINMSLVGPRIKGGPEECGTPDDPDPEHVAICAAVAAGMTVVVAAGNARANARDWAPAGYDQVVTVAALSDFDGLPGGLAAPTCGPTSFGPERDDRFARYSNFGSDVDLVAPGSCIRSTTSGSGDATKVLTGTSMAAPHVTGAVARYLAAHPGTSPGRMRALLRVAGSLDWTARSDPDWDGPASGRGPDRLLDVAALLDPEPGLVVWLLPTHVRAGRSTGAASVRVDVQRIGGQDGAAELDLAGLPATVASRTFSPSASLPDDGTTGRRLVLSFVSDAPEGSYTPDVTAGATSGSSGTSTASRGLGVRVDRTGPAIVGPDLRIRAGRPMPSVARLPTRATWTADDALGAVSRTVLQRAAPSGTWRTVAAADESGARALEQRVGRRVRLRVQATDDVGNRSTRRVERRVVAVDPASPAVTRSIGWRERSARAAVGGSLLASSLPGARLSASLKGRGIALVGPVGPSRGSLRFRIDGGAWTTVSLRRTQSRDRFVVVSRQLAAGTHDLVVEVIDGRVALDAILLMR
jgi:subtilisin family serine protease